MANSSSSGPNFDLKLAKGKFFIMKIDIFELCETIHGLEVFKR